MSVGQVILWKLGWSAEARELARARSSIQEAVQGVSRHEGWRQRLGGDFAFLEDYMESLLGVVAALICVRRVREYPEICRVAQLALEGFLPVDVDLNGGHERIVVALAGAPNGKQGQPQ